MPDDRYFDARPVLAFDTPSPRRIPGRPSLLAEHPELFEASHGLVRCMMCGRRGYDDSGPTSWARHCVDGHPFHCPAVTCDRPFSTLQALSAHRRHAEGGRHVTEVPA